VHRARTGEARQHLVVAALDPELAPIAGRHRRTGDHRAHPEEQLVDALVLRVAQPEPDPGALGDDVGHPAALDDRVVHAHRRPDVLARTGALENATLEPGESRETEFHLRTLLYVADGEQYDLKPLVSHGWMDVTLYVSYRDRDGFLREVRDHLTVSR